MRRRASGEAHWQKFTAVTSILPFGAILARRSRFAFTPMDWTRLALGLGLYVVLLYAHGWAFGVHDGLIQDLGITVDGGKPIENQYRAAVQRIRYKWSKPAEASPSEYIK